MYCIVSVFGVDAVDITFFETELLARASLKENLKMCSEDDSWEVEEKNDAEYYIVNKTETDPTAYIEFVLRKVN